MLGVGLLVIATGVNWLYAVRLSSLNAGRRLPIVTGQYPVRPPARVAALRAVCAGLSVYGALVLAQEFWSERPLLGPFLCAGLAVLVMVVPTLVVTVVHNRHLHLPAH
ncbi:hypothetical protein C8E04_6117 [Rhodococcus globerulus]|nr:hypothetical protein C8E04_6117 [Rhodococcus globerulus]